MERPCPNVEFVNPASRVNQIKDLKLRLAQIFKKTKRITNILRSDVTRANSIYLFFHPK